MQPISVRKIQQVVKGELVKGSEQWSIKHAIYYQRHDLTHSHTMLFVSKHEPIHWQTFQQYEPVLIVTDKPLTELQDVHTNATILYVRSLVQAYWLFLDYYRKLFQIPVVALTGTCGKTTVKEMMKHIASQEWAVQASISSKNEPRQSLPYLTGIDKQTEAAIFELGLGNTGNIKHQCMIYQPTIGIMTNIGVHHLDGCKNLAGYIKAKGELLEGIRQGGTLIINADDRNIQQLPISSFRGKVFTFGLQVAADYRATQIQYSKKGMTFMLHFGDDTYKAFVAGFGEHQVYNALAAIAGCHRMGLSLPTILAHLRTFQPMARHLEVVTGVNGSMIIDDTWTNNPTSIEAALKVLGTMGKGKKVIVILGDIKRLGQFEEKYHREIGTLLAKQTVHTLVTIGKKAEFIAKQAQQDGTMAEVHCFKDAKDVLEFLKPKLDKGSIVLVKGPMSSRSMIDFAKRLRAQE
ncbi:UDP-N-acetylmuramoyl-tripeptide--D-alanyl-D-alanine ligase [Lysinibacillus piscis]|uniref:UDP-N-acetylmuramoyl-tripeptide--D-alanyl-D-alanine ligase n=1 Tax=Lysinibacillus piscis TaxID=2518931 RepID=A0ABQ5NLR8_9BACI|nr:UDP-N-acetylmuramoyl-tripeptide--D-alanyl-D-alanine ligase [Lysinibacillus sp. KH24]GLC89295.1 UDP-N-acetylmuramoyl-tripeptide--D-alanyl-D-alanine ligase [Lysinibacillus sp. KH24]